MRDTSCSTAPVICVSGNDLCHSAFNWDLTLQLTHMLFIAVSAIPLYSHCVWQHCPTGKKDSVDTSQRVGLNFACSWQLEQQVQLSWHLLYDAQFRDKMLLGQFKVQVLQLLHRCLCRAFESFRHKFVQLSEFELTFDTCQTIRPSVKLTSWQKLNVQNMAISLV